MAGSLGSLVVSLGLNAYEFTTGLERSEYKAKRFAERVDRDIAKGIIKAQIAIEAFAKTVQTAFAKTITDVGNFKQLSEQIGDTAQNVAALDKASASSGVSLQDIAGISSKLALTLAKTDDEGDNAAQALKALGLNVADFKALAPVAQLEALAKAMDQFGDNSSKTAVSIALLGKSGATALPFLQDLAAQGGKTVQLTQDQIETIDRYSKSVAVLGQEFATTGRIIASEFISWLMKMREEMREGISIAGGLGSALVLFGNISPFKSTTENIREMTRALEEANQVSTQGGFIGLLNKLSGDFAGRATANTRKQLEFLKLQQRQEALALISESNLDARDLKARQKPLLDFSIDSKGGKASAQKAQITEAQRYLESLEKQLQATLDLNEVQKAEVEIYDLKQKALSGLTPAIEAQIRDYAAQIQAAQDLKKAQEEQRKQEDEAARIRERTSQMVTRQIEQAQDEAKQIAEGNRQIELQIAFLQGGEDAVRAIEKARLANVIALKEETLAMEQNTNGNSALAQELENQIRLLKDRQALIGQVGIAEQMRIDAEKLQDLKDTMSDALVQPLVDFVNQTKSAKDAFKSFINSIQQTLAQKAARGLADYIFGGKTQSGFDFSTIFKLFSGFFGGGGGLSGAGLDAGTFGPGSGLGFGNYAMGTNFHPGGAAWVGENGPELVRLPRGAQVMTSERSRQMSGNSMVFNVNVMPGANTQSARQAGGLLRDAVVRSMKDR